MFETMIKILSASWDVLLESSLFILLGFFIAGVLKAFISDDFIQKHLGKGETSSVFKASLFGIPIPLCSCGVIPAAAGLREQGASRGAVSAFMISTPETGVDSIAVTYALLDPVMTIIRPVSAFFTAAITGIVVNMVDSSEINPGNSPRISPRSDAPLSADISGTGALSSCSCSGSCSQSSDNSCSQSSDSSQSSDKGCNGAAKNGLQNQNSGFKDKFRRGMGFAFGELLGDIGPWLLTGIMLAGVITVYITPGFIEAYLGESLFSMVIMIAVATPLYVCATASTPIAAALALKGLSPGAALVFLLAGPATNVATITVVSKLFGRKITALYLLSIMGCSLLMGVATNWLYSQLGLDITGWVQSGINEEHGIVSIIAAVSLLTLIVKPFITKILHIKEEKEHSHCHCRH